MPGLPVAKLGDALYFGGGSSAVIKLGGTRDDFGSGRDYLRADHPGRPPGKYAHRTRPPMSACWIAISPAEPQARAVERIGLAQAEPPCPQSRMYCQMFSTGLSSGEAPKLRQNSNMPFDGDLPLENHKARKDSRRSGCDNQASVQNNFKPSYLNLESPTIRLSRSIIRAHAPQLRVATWTRAAEKGAGSSSAPPRRQPVEADGAQLCG
jgi:hypothetical protein